MKRISKVGIVGLMLLFASKACQNSTQVEGQCTSCEEDHFLSNGHCYEEIKGCQYQIQEICLSCQNGWILQENECHKLKEKKQIRNLQNQIIRSVGGYKILDPKIYNTEPQFLIAKKQILKLYPNFNMALVSKVQMQVVSGTNVLTTFKLDKNSKDQYKVNVLIPLPPNISYVKVNGVTVKSTDNGF